MPKQTNRRIIDSQNSAVIRQLQARVSVSGSYVPLDDYEDADVLAKLLNVDGAGSGLDADLLDGKQAVTFLWTDGSKTGATAAAQTFTLGVVDSTLTPTRLLASNGSKQLVSVANLASWVAGTANQVTVTDDADGTITLSLPQNIHSAATPTFAGIIAAYLKPAADSTTALQLQQAGGTAVVTVDTTNSRTSITGRLTLEDSTTSNKAVYVGANRFLHNFHHPTGGAATPTGLNTFAGVNAGNFTIGSGAGAATEGSRNAGFGSNVLQALTTGYNNAGLGNNAGYAITTGHNNMAFGESALAAVETGNYNVAIGSNALRLLTGSNNIGIGYTALYNITASNNNVAIGHLAGRFHADGTTALTVAANSIYIGASARGKDNSDSNSIVIGYTAIGLGAQTTVIGGSTSLLFQAWGAHRLVNVAVPTAAADTVDLYATDLTAGDSALHIRSETGAIWKFGSRAVLPEGGHIELGTTTGTKIGTATNQKLAFFNATPIAQRSHVADPSGGATVDSEARTAINAILATLEAYGFHATS